MTDFVPDTKPKNRKYFFGYYLLNGVPSAMKWMEDNGLVVGGIPHVIGHAVEITEEEFQPDCFLADLEKLHPYPEKTEHQPDVPVSDSG